MGQYTRWETRPDLWIASRMPNRIFRDRLIARIEGARAEYLASASLDHPGSVGRAREIALNQLLMPIVPGYVQSVTGHIADHRGKQSGQIDVVLYDSRILAPVLFDATFGVVPAEACLFAIEVKSKLDATKLKAAAEGAHSVAELECRCPRPPLEGKDVPPPPGRASALRGMLESPEAPFMPILSALFAFDSDLSPGGMNELDRYFECDPQARHLPSIWALCVFGRGFWRFNPREGWTECPPTARHDEVVDFLGVLVNSLPLIAASRGQPAWGRYVIEDRPTRLIGGGLSVTRNPVG
jgi:hypothetical protein